MPAHAQTVVIDETLSNSPTVVSSPNTLIADDLTVGSTSAGKLSVVDGGSAQVGLAMVGQSLASNGELTVAGADSVWGGTQSLTIGYMGTGALTVADGARVTLVDFGYPYFGTLALGSAGGIGSLLVRNGGRVSSSNGQIGNRFTSGSGNAIVTGQGSAWSAGYLDLANGSLTISDGGAVSGSGYFESGSALITGPGSNWTGRELNLRDASALTVADRGQVVVQDLIVAGATVRATDTGTVISAGNLQVEPSGHGMIDVVNGAQLLDATGSIGNGTVLVTGSGSFWSTKALEPAYVASELYGQLSVGKASTGSLTIADGGRVVSGESFIGLSIPAGGLKFFEPAQLGSGTASVTGADSAWEISGRLQIGDHSEGKLIIADGGEVVANNGVNLGIIGKGDIIIGSLDAPATTGPGFLETPSIVLGGSAGAQETFGNVVYRWTATQVYPGGKDTVVFSHNGVGYVFAPDISGDGTVSNLAGTTILTGQNTYSGTTLVAGGTLIGSATAFGSSAIIDDAKLVIDQPATGTMANLISGRGLLVKDGTGSLDLTGVSPFSGATEVKAGALLVNGSLANSTVTITNGALLGGKGTVGGVVALGGSIVSPGNSPGTLTVAGDYVQTAGSTYLVEIAPDGTSDLILVGGKAKIEPGAVLKLAVGSIPRLGQPLTVLRAAGGIDGSFTFPQATEISRFAGLIDFKTANSIEIYYGQIRSFTVAATSPEETFLALALDSLSAGSPLAGKLLLLPDDAAARATFGVLSGYLHPAMRGVLTGDSRIPREAVLTHLDANVVDGRSAWLQAIGNWGTSEGAAGRPDVKRDSTGVVGGVDLPVGEDVRIGLAGHYIHTKIALRGGDGNGTIETVGLLAYGGLRRGGFGLRAGLGYAHATLRTSRRAMFTGFAESLDGSYQGSVVQAFAEAGYRIEVGRESLEPVVEISWVRAKTGRLQETGGSAALAGDSVKDDCISSIMGLRFASTLTAPWRIRGRVGWRHAFGELEPTSVFAFAGSSSFPVAGTGEQRDALLLDVDLLVSMAKRVTVGLTYNAVVSNMGHEQMLRGGLTIQF